MAKLIFRDLGTVAYEETLESMQQFTRERGLQTPDEIWFLQHPPVFTQGRHGKKEHVLGATHIPIVQTDRGGQVTYHGPGQLVVYFLLDLRRAKIGVRELVEGIENSIIGMLNHFGVRGHRVCKSPGVFVNRQKIASIGLRVSKGCTYHGAAINIDMDLGPFLKINPCGMAGLVVTHLVEARNNKHRHN